MDKNLIIGVVAGVGIAVAGGVAGFTMMGEPSGQDQAFGVETEIAEIEAAPADTRAEPVAAQAVTPAPAAPRPAAARPAPQPVQTAQAAPPPAPVEECWEEEVEVPAEARDEKAIAGTAAGALIGGALADRLGDDDDLVTAAGAAAGAFIGRKAQRQFQENRTTTEIVTRCGTR